MHRTIKCCLIDLDGTLADSIPILLQAYLEFMKSNGLVAKQEDFFRMMGPSLREIFQSLQSDYGFSQDPVLLAQEYQEQLFVQYATKVPLMLGAKEALQELSKTKELAIVTSAPAKLTWAFLERHQMAPLFSAVCTSEGLQHSKPHPEIYRRALRTLKHSVQETIAIEDSLSGVTSATQAGLKTLWLTARTLSSEVPNEVTLLPDWLAIQRYLGVLT